MSATLHISLAQAQVNWNNRPLKLTPNEFLCLAHVAYSFQQQSGHADGYDPKRHAISAETLQEYGVFRGCQPTSLKATVSRTRKVILQQAPLLYDLTGLNSSHFALDTDTVREVRFNLPPEEVGDFLGYREQPEPPPASEALLADLALIEAQLEAEQWAEAADQVGDLLAQPDTQNPYVVIRLLDLQLRVQEQRGVGGHNLDEVEALVKRARHLLPEVKSHAAEAQAVAALMQARALRWQRATQAALQLTGPLQLDPPPSDALTVRVNMLHGALLLDQADPDYHQATLAFEKALRLASEMKWWWGIQTALKNLGRLHYLRSQRLTEQWRWQGHRQSLETFARAYRFSEGLRQGSLDPEALIYMVIILREQAQNPAYFQQVAPPHTLPSPETLLQLATRKADALPDGSRKAALHTELRRLLGGGAH